VSNSSRSPQFIDEKVVSFLGNRFGRLVVTAFIGKLAERGRSICEFKCDCGNVIYRRYSAIATKSGGRSCGCIRIERARVATIKALTKHGMTATPEHSSWASMKGRCYNKNDHAWSRYGGRGISIYPAWRSDFSAFYKHIGPRPTPEHSVDRIDNDGNYEPGNVRWATPRQQACNRRNSIYIEVNGELAVVSRMARKYGVPVQLVYKRLRRGWCGDDAILVPNGAARTPPSTPPSHRSSDNAPCPIPVSSDSKQTDE